MQSSCAQVRSILSSASWTTGIERPAAYRCTTATKISSVAAPIRNAISHSSRWSRNFIAPPLKRRASVVADGPVSRLEAGFFVDLGDRVLADPRLVLLVHANER